MWRVCGGAGLGWQHWRVGDRKEGEKDKEMRVKKQTRGRAQQSKEM